MAEATRAKVLEAAAELDFEPNLLARGLVMQRTHIVGVLVHDLTDEFYARIVRGIEDVAFANDFSVVVCETDRDPDKEIAYVRRLRSQRVDAIIYAGSSAADAAKQDRDRRAAPPGRSAGAVLLRLAPHATVEPDVSYSTREGFGLLVDHLVGARPHASSPTSARPPRSTARRSRATRSPRCCSATASSSAPSA